MWGVSMTLKVFLSFALVILVLDKSDVNANPLAFKKTEDASLQEDEKEPRPSLLFSAGEKTTIHKMIKPRTVNEKSFAKSFRNEESLNMPGGRCGHPSQKHRTRRHVSAFKWQKLRLSWSVQRFSQKMTHLDQLKVFDRAFETWANVTILKFFYIPNYNHADIRLGFYKGHHGCLAAFDGAGLVIAHAVSIVSLMKETIHFDEAEDWSASPSSFRLHLLPVAIHEIGHAIGLDHTDNAADIMYDSYDPSVTTLSPNDIANVRKLYGTCQVRNILTVFFAKVYGGPETLFVIRSDKVYRIEYRHGTLLDGPLNVKQFFGAQALDPRLKTLRAVFYDADALYYYFLGESGMLGIYAFYSRGKFRFYLNDAYKAYANNFKLIEGKKKLAVAIHDHVRLHFFMGGNYISWSLERFKSQTPVIIPMQTKFPGAPLEPDAAYFSKIKNEFFFIQDNKMYKKNAVTNQYQVVADLTLHWTGICP